MCILGQIVEAELGDLLTARGLIIQSKRQGFKSVISPWHDWEDIAGDNLEVTSWRQIGICKLSLSFWWLLFLAAAVYFLDLSVSCLCVHLPSGVCSVGFQPGMSKRQGQLGPHWPPDCILLLWLFCFSLHHLGARLQAACSKRCQTQIHSSHSPCVCTCATRESALS